MVIDVRVAAAHFGGAIFVGATPQTVVFSAYVVLHPTAFLDFTRKAIGSPGVHFSKWDKSLAAGVATRPQPKSVGPQSLVAIHTP